MFPKDPVMLLSFVNMKLRDQYDSLESLCEDFDVQQEYLENQLAKINYYYNKESNQFK